MIIAGTGHRNDKLPNPQTGYKLPNPTYIKVCQKIESALLEFKPEKVITGMALGCDQWLAMIAYKLKIPYLAAIPFVNQEAVWPEASKRVYNILRQRASEEVIISSGGYAASKMQIRNEFMCNACDKLIAIYNGDLNGGTYNCIQYAKSIGKEVIIIDPKV